MDEFRTGMRVVHPLFGAGTVRSVAGSGADAKISVEFSRQVGLKKLIASVAKLRPLGEPNEDQDEARRIWGAAKMPAPDTVPESRWYELFEAACRPKHGRNPPEAKLLAVIKAGIIRHDFWTEVREAMRALNLSPKVLDNPSGHVSIGVEGFLKVRIAIEHDELIDKNSARMGKVVFDVLAHRYLGDFENITTKCDVGIDNLLVEHDVVVIPSEDLGSLPDRSPRRKPLPDRAPGTITNRPRRRDDY